MYKRQTKDNIIFCEPINTKAHCEVFKKKKGMFMKMGGKIVDYENKPLEPQPKPEKTLEVDSVFFSKSKFFGEKNMMFVDLE